VTGDSDLEPPSFASDPALVGLPGGEAVAVDLVVSVGDGIATALVGTPDPAAAVAAAANRSLRRVLAIVVAVADTIIVLLLDVLFHTLNDVLVSSLLLG
jgi:hypothetical protein